MNRTGLTYRPINPVQRVCVRKGKRNLCSEVRGRGTERKVGKFRTAAGHARNSSRLNLATPPDHPKTRSGCSPCRRCPNGILLQSLGQRGSQTSLADGTLSFRKQLGRGHHAERKPLLRILLHLVTCAPQHHRHAQHQRVKSEKGVSSVTVAGQAHRGEVRCAASRVHSLGRHGQYSCGE